MTTLEILKAARELLSDPKRWTKGNYAKSADKLPISPASPNASCFCMVGALAHVSGSTASITSVYLADEAAQACQLLEKTVEFVPDWNDAPERTHAEVLELFDKAIARLEASPC